MRALLVVVVMGCAHEPRLARAARANEPTLEVMSFNVNFGIPGDAETLALIEQSTAQLVVLQETTPEWEAAARAALMVGAAVGAARPHRRVTGAGAVEREGGEGRPV